MTEVKDRVNELILSGARVTQVSWLDKSTGRIKFQVEIHRGDIRAVASGYGKYEVARDALAQFDAESSA